MARKDSVLESFGHPFKDNIDFTKNETDTNDMILTQPISVEVYSDERWWYSEVIHKGVNLDKEP